MKNFFHFLVLALTWCCGAAAADNSWGPVTNNVQMAIWVRNDAPTFNADEINDPAPLVDRIRGHRDDLSAFLWQQASPQQQAAFMNLQSSELASRQARTNLADLLNRVIAGGCFYTTNRYSSTVLQPETKRLISQYYRIPYGSYSPAFGVGPDYSTLNRLLLEDAYPYELARRMNSAGIMVKKGDAVTLIIAFRDLATNESFLFLADPNILADRLIAFHVVRPSGQRVTPEPAYPASRSLATHKFAPGSPVYVTCHFSEKFNFYEIGRYVITLEANVHSDENKDPVRWHETQDPEGWFTLVSNPLSIDIVPDK
ncbi:MAG: hypothetical protein ABSG04_14240 [Verrucomicrobiota bacterium]|jgi:hypothetical protein